MKILDNAPKIPLLLNDIPLGGVFRTHTGSIGIKTHPDATPNSTPFFNLTANSMDSWNAGKERITVSAVYPQATVVLAGLGQ